MEMEKREWVGEKLDSLISLAYISSWKSNEHVMNFDNKEAIRWKTHLNPNTLNPLTISDHIHRITFEKPPSSWYMHYTSSHRTLSITFLPFPPIEGLSKLWKAVELRVWRWRVFVSQKKNVLIDTLTHVLICIQHFSFSLMINY